MERFHKAAVATALALALVSGAAGADPKPLGVEVYPGAEYVSAKSTLANKALGVSASCFRTKDAFAAVQAFYAGMPGFMEQETNVLRRGNVDVVLNPPPADPRTGLLGSYTGFCIMQAKD